MEVSLFGHSLGGVIAFDLMTKPAHLCPSLPVRNIFCAGSPLGFFLAIRRLSTGVRGVRCRCCALLCG